MSDLVGTPNCWFSHVKAQMLMHWSEESMVADRGRVKCQALKQYVGGV